MPIDLLDWNLCTPELDPATGYARIHSTAELQTLNNGYFARRFDNIVMTAPVTGAVTKSTDRTRTELRETFSDGTLRNWQYPGVDHKMTAALRVERLPSNGIIVVGQIHSAGGDPLVKLKYKRDALYASVRAEPGVNPVDRKVLDVPPMQRFTYSIHLSPGGHLGISAGYTGVDGVKRTGSYDTELAGNGWDVEDLYFKAGTYNQDAIDETGDEYSRVTFYVLNVRHI